LDTVLKFGLTGTNIREAFLDICTLEDEDTTLTRNVFMRLSVDYPVSVSIRGEEYFDPSEDCPRLKSTGM
jgi:hypothetical protein